ncbi:hypothetical protein ACQV2C_00200 [Pantoea allii]|nr:hypothetical protein [Pantoea allii]
MLKVRNALLGGYAAWVALWKNYLRFYGQDLDDIVPYNIRL